ncbi:hypothetical protein, partial [Corynebacterium tuscaniense]
LPPHSTRKKDNNKKHPISHATNQTTPSHQWFRQHRPAHTPKKEVNSHKPTKQKSLAHYRVLTQHTHTLRETVSAPFEAACSTLLEINTLCQLACNIVFFSLLRPVHLAVTVRKDGFIQ